MKVIICVENNNHNALDISHRIHVPNWILNKMDYNYLVKLAFWDQEGIERGEESIESAQKGDKNNIKE